MHYLGSMVCIIWCALFEKYGVHYLENMVCIIWEIWCALYQGLIDPPKAGRGHATLIGPSQTAKC